MTVEELIGAALTKELIAGAIAHEFRQLNSSGVANMLGVSPSTVRRNEALMAISRDIPGIGRRWDAGEVQIWIKSHGSRPKASIFYSDQ